METTHMSLAGGRDKQIVVNLYYVDNLCTAMRVATPYVPVLCTGTQDVPMLWRSLSHTPLTKGSQTQKAFVVVFYLYRLREK